jgi:predicted GNAT family acetyltransferase
MFQVKLMSLEDIPFAVQLANTMNWNMKQDDFKFMRLLEPEGCFVISDETKPIGIATSISYGKAGWIGNFIVKKEHRKRGAGSLLIKHAIKYLQNKGVKTVGLYAYPNLIDFYNNFGFKVDEDFAVLHAQNLSSFKHEILPEIKKRNIRAITKLDTECFGANRQKLLKAIIDKKNFGYFISENDIIVGYIIAKITESTAEVGPLICKTEKTDASLRLLRAISDKLTNLNVYLYLPMKERELIDFLLKIGFKIEFHVSRMFLGSVNIKSCIYIAESLERG